MIAIPTTATSAPQIVVLICFAAFFQLLFVVQLTGLTKVNMVWSVALRGCSTMPVSSCCG